MKIFEKAYAKLNISLDILGRYPNGYHRMDMVMQSVSLCDDVELDITDGCGNITVETDNSALPNDRSNIGYKAAEVFFTDKCVTDKDIHIKIIKKVPFCAGMGGGSSDGAAVLRGINTALGKPCSASELESMGKKIGSDVPFCVCGGTARAVNTGTELVQISPMQNCFFLLCKPEFSVSTPELFKKIDSAVMLPHPETERVISAIERGDIAEMGKNMGNVFEAVLEDKKQTVDDIKKKILSFKAEGACLTGTGSVVFGVFTDREKAEAAGYEMKKHVPFCEICEPTKRIEI